MVTPVSTSPTDSYDSDTEATLLVEGAMAPIRAIEALENTDGSILELIDKVSDAISRADRYVGIDTDHQIPFLARIVACVYFSRLMAQREPSLVSGVTLDDIEVIIKSLTTWWHEAKKLQPGEDLYLEKNLKSLDNAARVTVDLFNILVEAGYSHHEAPFKALYLPLINEFKSDTGLFNPVGVEEIETLHHLVKDLLNTDLRYLGMNEDDIAVMEEPDYEALILKLESLTGSNPNTRSVVEQFKQEHTNPTKVSFVGKDFSKFEDIKALFDHIGPTVEELELRDCSLGAGVEYPLCKLLASAPKLRVVCLAGNSLDSEIVLRAMVGMTRIYDSVEDLDLSDNLIDLRGLLSIIVSLPSTRTLKRVNLSRNIIDSEDGQGPALRQMIANKIADHPSMELINIQAQKEPPSGSQ